MGQNGIQKRLAVSLLEINKSSRREQKKQEAGIVL
jgi:hypothetical protein